MNSATTPAYGVRLRALRERAGLNQRALAARAGVSQSVISRIESGKTPKMPELLNLAAGLGTTLGALTGISEVRQRLTYAARSDHEATSEALKDRMAFYLELDAHLADLGYRATR